MPRDKEYKMHDNLNILSGKSILDLIGKKGIEDMYDKKSGFFDLPVKSISLCNHKEHNPPSHLYIPPGKGYRHICPACNNVIEIIPPQITL